MRKVYKEEIWELAEQLYNTATYNLIGVLDFDKITPEEKDALCEASQKLATKVRNIYVKE